jgi:SAM-dependent methyltransferase
MNKWKDASPSQPSYQTFAYVYDQLMADMPYGEWLGWLESYWSIHGRPTTIVDLGCGTGTIAIPLAQSGMQVKAIDLSKDMLQVANRKAMAAQQDMTFTGTLEWVEADMRRWSTKQKVDSVISLCDCLNYMTSEEDLLLTFQSTYNGLVDGGTFLFDMHHWNQLADVAAHEPYCLDEEDLAYIWTCQLDETVSSLEHRLVLFVREDNRFIRVVESHRQRAFPASTVVQLLKKAGFDHVETYADFTYEPIDHDTTLRMFFVAVKGA